MTTARIGTEHECLSLTRDVDGTSQRPDIVLAELHLDGLSASLRVVRNYATGFSDLADFFRGLTDDWRGWTGSREWESLEHDMRIEARHQSGHVQLRVTLHSSDPSWANEGWRATGDLTIEAGEQLTNIANDVRRLSGGS